MACARRRSYCLVAKGLLKYDNFLARGVMPCYDYLTINSVLTLKRKKMDLETIWYETSPYIYTISGVLAFATAEARIGQVSGVLLLGAAMTVIRLRWVNRRKN